MLILDDMGYPIKAGSEDWMDLRFKGERSQAIEARFEPCEDDRETTAPFIDYRPEDFGGPSNIGVDAFVAFDRDFDRILKFGDLTIADPKQTYSEKFGYPVLECSGLIANKMVA